MSTSPAAVPVHTGSDRLRDCLVVLLTVGTGVVDAAGFLRLGGVFTSVMTANMVRLGLAMVNYDGSIVLHTLTSFVAYITGNAIGAKVAGSPKNDGERWPQTFQRALCVEFALFACFAIGWWATGSAPSERVGYILLAINSTAIGVQAGSLLRLGISGLSTTYLTGTLTTVVAAIVHRVTATPWRSIAILIALIIGAVIGGAVTIYAPVCVPFVVLGISACVIGLGQRFLLTRSRTSSGVVTTA